MGHSLEEPEEEGEEVMSANVSNRILKRVNKIQLTAGGYQHTGEH